MSMDSDVSKYNTGFAKKCEKSDPTTPDGYVSLDEENSDYGEGSDELFSDNDDKKELSYYSPNVSQPTENSSFNLSDTSLLHSDSLTATPSTAVVPSTPLSLVPFLTRINEQWTSDLETPQADKTLQQHMDRPMQSTESAEKNNSLKQCTPNNTNCKSRENECVSTSPVIISKRVRKRPKRRIFKLSTIGDGISSLQKDDTHETPMEVCATVQITAQQQTLDSMSRNADTSNIPLKSTDIHTDVKNKADINTVPDSLNTSTQNFFNNASFSDVDKICMENFTVSNVITDKSDDNEIKSPNTKKVECSRTTSPDNIKKNSSREDVGVDAIYSSSDVNKTVETESEGLKRMTFSEVIPPNSFSLPCGLLPREEETLKNVQSPQENNTQSQSLNVQEKFSLGTSCANINSMGFATASGKKCHISDSALAKAQSLFAACNEDEFLSNDNALPVQFSESTTKTNPVNSNARPHSLSAVRKQATVTSENNSSRAHLPKEFDRELPKETIDKSIAANRSVPSAPFSTGIRRSLHVSKEAPSKARSVSENEIDTTNKVYNDLQGHKNESETRQNFPAVSFSTASGKSVKISDKSLANAKRIFGDDFDFSDLTASFSSERVSSESKGTPIASISTLTIAENINQNQKMDCSNYNAIEKTSDGILLQQAIRDEHGKRTDPRYSLTMNMIEPSTQSKDKTTLNVNLPEKYEIPSIGFKTCRGKSITVSDKALANAHRIFSQEFEEMQISKKVCTDDNEPDERKAQTSNIGFQTAGGRGINVTKEALLKAKTLFAGETLEEIESSSLETKSFNKRKSKDLDDEITTSTQSGQQLKKPRFINEPQATKSIHGDATNLELESNEILTDEQNRTKSIQSDSLKKADDKCNYGFSVSNEIIESTAALLADEESSVSSECHSSPAKTNKEEDIADAPSSPVIGRQTVLRKRRIARNRIKTVSTPTDTQHASVSNAVSCQTLSCNIVNVDNPQKATNTITNKVCEKEVSSSNASARIVKSHADEKNTQSTKEQDLSNAQKQLESINADAFGDTQLMLDFIIQSANILEKRLAAALEQDKAISLKKVKKIKPIAGQLFSYKTSNKSNRIFWREITKRCSPTLRTYKELMNEKLSSEILDITAVTATEYRFRCTDFYGLDVVQSNTDGLNVGDGALLILDENGYAGVSEVKRSFLASPGVDPNLIPAGWVENHYGWIVWKLASIDRTKFSSVTLPRALTPSTLMAQLKYRYDREIDRSQRPALRKILEKDDVASKTMVLCVSSIVENNDVANVSTSPKMICAVTKKLTLTDGWYSIIASVDFAMMQNIRSGKVKEGTKLITYGAELLNCDQGCSPLEVPVNVALKLHTNSTRRARWDTKLGYVAPAGPLRVKLRSIHPSGGLVGKIVVVVARVYPMLYHEKTPTGESIFRNARCEEKAKIAYEEMCRLKIEAFYAKTEKYVSGGGKSSSSETDSIDLAAAEWNESCERLSKEEFVPTQEKERLLNECHAKQEQFQQKLNSRLHKNLPPPRQVTPLLKIRVIEGDVAAILTIWSPSEELTDTLKEGNPISICNVTASGKRAGELQLSAGRNALFDRQSGIVTTYPHRTYTALSDVMKPSFTPTYGEFDTVGIIVSITNAPYGMKNFEAIHLAYPRTDDSQSSYLSVLFWNSIAAHGYAEILTVGSLVACSNLEWRRVTSWNIPMAHCTERSVFTRNPRQNHLQQAFQAFKTVVTDVNEYIGKCATEVSGEIQKKSLSNTDGNSTPDGSRFGKTMYNDMPSCEKQIIHSAHRESSSRSLTCSSSQAAKSTVVQRRIDKLQHYGDGPKLSPIVLRSSKRVMMDFQSPVRSSTTNVGQSNTQLNKKLLYDSE